MQRHQSPTEKAKSQVALWRDHLLEITNRNPLINTNLQSTRGALEIMHPEPEVIWRRLITSSEASHRAMRFPWKKDLVPPPEDTASAPNKRSNKASQESTESDIRNWNPPLETCISSRKLQKNDILTSLGDRALDRRIRTLDNHARLSMSEQGINCLFLVFGFIKWFETTDSQKELRSPLILIPATLSRDSADSPWELLEADDDVIDNLCMRQRFKQDFGLELPPLPELEELEEQGARKKYLDKVRKKIAQHERWEIEDRCCIGRFAFPKIAMWNDLGDHIDSIAANPICQSIAGAESDTPQFVFGDATSIPNAEQLDDTLQPGSIKAILDCDSSQLEAIVAANRGLSFVLDGPPGTGKSQTIANIIADALSRGKKVLFVSEKVAALEVVKRRLDACNLGDFCLECHSSKANRKDVVDALKSSLDLPTESYDSPHDKYTALHKQRQLLNDYVRTLHQPQQPIGLSIYELQGQIARLDRRGALHKTRLKFPRLDKLSRTRMDAWEQLSRLAPEHRNILSNIDAHPWRDCCLTTQPLGLKADILKSFTDFADDVDKLLHDLAPLTQPGLISLDIPILHLPHLASQLKTALEVPNIPSAWFTDLRDVANRVLSRGHYQAFITRTLESLTDYADNAVNDFTHNIALLSDERTLSWTKQLTHALPNDLTARCELLSSHSRLLRSLAMSLTTLDDHLKHLITELRIPIKQDPQIGSVEKLLSAASIVASHPQFRAGWFEPAHAASLAESAHDAIRRIPLIQAIEESIEGRISPQNLLSLARSFPEPDKLHEQWISLTTRLKTTEKSTLANYEACLSREHALFERINAELPALLTRLGWGDHFTPTIHDARALLHGIPHLMDAGGYVGRWRDAETRSGLKSAIREAIQTITEAKEIQQALESRMSHRAFLPSLRPLIEKGTKYSSWWTRLIGGFTQYRSAIADIYKTQIPDTQTLLSDLLLLRTYHNRINEVQSQHAFLKAVLLPDTTPNDVASWQKTLTAIERFESFIVTAPNAALAMPANAVSIPMQLDDVAFIRLQEALEKLQTGQRDDIVSFLGLAALTPEQARLATESLLNDVHSCMKAMDAVEARYLTAPDIETFFDDIRKATAYLDHTETVARRFADHSKDLQENTSPFQAETWYSAIRGVEAANKLLDTFTKASARIFTNSICAPEAINHDSLTNAVAATSTALQQANRALTETLAFIQLSRLDQPAVEPNSRPARELASIADEAALDFETIQQSLSCLIGILKPGHSVPFERLSGDWDTFQEVRISQALIDECNSNLNQYATDPLDATRDDLISTSKWINEASDDQLSDPLTKTIATNPEARPELQKAFSQLSALTEAIAPHSSLFETLFNQKPPVSPRVSLAALHLPELSAMLRELVRSIDSFDEWISFNNWRSEMCAQGLGIIVEELLSHSYTPEEAADILSGGVYTQLFDLLVPRLPVIGNFDSVRHEQLREQYRLLDEWETKAAATQVRQFQLNREDRPRAGWSISATNELGILRREAEKKRRHMPLRRLFEEIPSVLQRLKPCIMMSPLSVSTFLQTDKIRFDLVIFDEASQVFPWDAIGAIYRGNQLIVAGDEKQLPPTSFFTRSDIETEEEEDDGLADFESILSLCKAANMPHKRLRWHYRSRREALIAFSNRHFYDGDLVTFPSARDATRDGVKFIHVANGIWSERKNVVEADKIAELVIQHYKRNPDKSLGVIALNMSQQQAIEDALYERRKSTRSLDALLRNTTSEPLFIKNLENVQGDERDVIILSVGYGLNDSGKFLKNFGPLSKQGGERRLNVAVTRAREELSLVASVRASDMDLTDSISPGARLLKAYLEYAESGVDSLARTLTEAQGQCESPFEEEVATALISHGLKPVPQVGCGGFRVDLALQHPLSPGVYCLGIECDGASYHSSKTARDRDRLRQSTLENLGWKICRVWSTEWVRNPERQIQRILTAYESAHSQSSASVEPRSSTSTPVPHELKPKYIIDQTFPQVVYSDINDVPKEAIIDIALRIVTCGGPIDHSDLITCTARELGFQRTGIRIRTRIEDILRQQVRQGKLHRKSNRISLP